jgi:hypothetical protein
MIYEHDIETGVSFNIGGFTLGGGGVRLAGPWRVNIVARKRIMVAFFSDEVEQRRGYFGSALTRSSLQKKHNNVN